MHQEQTNQIYPELIAFPLCLLSISDHDNLEEKTLPFYTLSIFVLITI